MSKRHPQTDPVYASSLRELKWILGIWLVSFVWVIGYCRWMGYRQDGDASDTLLPTVFGMPSWVFWGIFVPWIVASVVSSWFALTQMEDHPLDDGPSDESLTEEASEHG